MDSLLPNNRTAFEHAVSATSAERSPLPAHLVADILDPERCPAHLLGYLAQSLSVDLWEEGWPEVKRREVCRRAYELHRLKTTVAGIKAHVELVGGTVERVIRPPASAHLRGVQTDEARVEWLDSLPQIRIYPYLTRSTAVGRHFHNGPGFRRFHSSRSAGSQPITDEDGDLITDENGAPIVAVSSVAWLESGDPADDAVVFIAGHLRATRGPSILGRRATYFDRGEETDIRLEGLEGGAVERVFLRRVVRRQWHGRGWAGAGFLTATTAALNVVTIRQNADIGLFAIGRGVETVEVRPQRVNQPRTAPASRSFGGQLFARTRTGANPARRYLLRSFAPNLVYDSIALHDPERLGARRKTRAYHGAGRFGIAPYTAELRIQVPMNRPVKRSGRFHGVGYRKAADMSPLRKAIEAVRVSKAERDTVLIDTAVHRAVQFGKGLRFGEFRFGEIRKVS